MGAMVTEPAIVVGGGRAFVGGLQACRSAAADWQ